MEIFISNARFGVNVHVELFDQYGHLKEERWAHNLIPTSGLTHIADQLASSPGEDAMGWMAVGEGSTVGSASTTTLESEVARVALDSRTHTGAVVTYIATFPAGTGDGSLAEAGILNAASDGIMLARLTFGVVTKTALDSLVVTWTLTASDDNV
jgi:hypothetical protein